MPVSRTLLAGLLCFAALTAVPAAQQSSDDEYPQFRTTVTEVIVPVTVTRGGDFVNGLEPHQFRLYDNGKEQNIRVDVTYQPISVVIAIQANDHVEAVLPQIRKIGSLIEPLMIGEQGEAAVLAFDHRLRVMQPFTSDSAKVADAVKKITAGSSSSRMIDAVMQSVRMLSSRPKNRRRILLLISETRDKASEGKTRDSVIALQVNNVELYSVDITRFVTTLTAKPQPGRPDPLPPAARQGTLPPGVPATPTTVSQTFGGQGGRAEFLPLLLEIYKDVKGIFIDNPVEVFTKATGGAEFGFVRQRGLEEAIGKIGEQLHSQYLITYTPNNKEEGGFHEIKVEITELRDYKARYRPGYWMAAVVK